MPETNDPIASRLAAVEARIAAAVARRGPGPKVRLIGVSKRQAIDKLVAAHAAGLRDFGENYAQELRDKQGLWAVERGARWHYIGALQSNKLKYLVGKVALIHTVDRPQLVAAIDRRAKQAGVVQDTLVEVALAGEAQKGGVPPQQLPAVLDAYAEAEHQAVRCVGLMLMPPAAAQPELTRPWFRKLRALRDQLVEAGARPGVALRELSMGMSGDFEIAIEEGATLVRVGTAVFGPRGV